MDTRRHGRVSEEFPVRLLHAAGAGPAREMDCQAVVSDLSRSGLCLRSRSVLLDVGETLPFALTLPGGDTLRGTARVRWNEVLGRSRLHGLEIVGLSFLDRERLRRHLTPRYFGWVEAGDLALQAAVAVLAALVLRSVLETNPALRSALAQALPYGICLAGAGIFWLLARS